MTVRDFAVAIDAFAAEAAVIQVIGSSSGAAAEHSLSKG